MIEETLLGDWAIRELWDVSIVLFERIEELLGSITWLFRIEGRAFIVLVLKGCL